MVGVGAAHVCDVLSVRTCVHAYVRLADVLCCLWWTVWRLTSNQSPESSHAQTGVWALVENA